MSENKGTQPATPSAEKAARDNRANQLNPNNPLYRSSRGTPPATQKAGSKGHGR